MYHDNSIGEIKLTLAVVRIALLHQEVNIDKVAAFGFIEGQTSRHQ